jgi:hypothetical protein
VNTTPEIKTSSPTFSAPNFFPVKEILNFVTARISIQGPPYVLYQFVEFADFLPAFWGVKIFANGGALHGNCFLKTFPAALC